MLERLSLFSRRKDEEEWMDQPATSAGDFVQALEDIRWVNRHLGGTQALLREVARLVERHHLTSLTVLDLGTGSADIPIALVRWAREKGLPIRVMAVDLHPLAVAASRKLAEGFPEIEIRQGDALHLDIADAAYDLVVSSMFMHHLQDTEAIHLLREMARMCRFGFIINDLERHPLAWLGIRSLGWMTGKGAVFRNDAPLSVLRGFSLRELESLRECAKLPGLKIKRQKPYRWVLSWERPG